MKQKMMIFTMFIALSTMLLIGGCIQESQPIEFTEVQEEAPVNETPEEQSAETELSSCEAFPDKLDSCEPFSCEFKHPFAKGELMERKVVGLINGKCQYTEEMPNNGRMDCEYSEDQRKVIAQHYRDTAVAESAGVSITTDPETGEIKKTYTIDGKEVENPLQEALDTGICVISGYW